VAEVGAIPIFADADPETLTIDPESVAATITPRTRAIIGVHYGGMPFDFDRLLPLARERGLFLIEDAAHAQGSAWRGRRVGAIGTFGSFSFQETKALPAGEGGIVLTNDADLADRARLLHSIGRQPGRPDYLHYALASNYRLGEFQAAVLLVQMAHLPAQVEARDATGRLLDAALTEARVLLPQRRDERVTTRGYYFAVFRYQAQVLDDLPRAAFVAAMRAEGVPCSAGYGLPVYKYDAFKPEALAQSPLRGVPGVPRYDQLFLPVTERVSQYEQVTMPHPLLLAGADGVRMIADSLAKVVEQRDDLRRWWREQEATASSTASAR
jgi:dTDP-4-amino-4,6-dideoxygalactose transaminase